MHKFKNISLQWDKNDLTILFLNKSHSTESFLVIKSLSLSDKIQILDIFITGHDNSSCVWKECAWTSQILKYSYRDFISWITDCSSQNFSIDSGNFEFIPLLGIEIRCQKGLGRELFPSEWGCQKILLQIGDEILTS